MSDSSSTLTASDLLRAIEELGPPPPPTWEEWQREYVRRLFERPLFEVEEHPLCPLSAALSWAYDFSPTVRPAFMITTVGQADVQYQRIARWLGHGKRPAFMLRRRSRGPLRRRVWQ